MATYLLVCGSQRIQPWELLLDAEPSLASTTLPCQMAKWKGAQASGESKEWPREFLEKLSMELMYVSIDWGFTGDCSDVWKLGLLVTLLFTGESPDIWMNCVVTAIRVTGVRHKGLSNSTSKSLWKILGEKAGLCIFRCWR